MLTPKPQVPFLVKSKTLLILTLYYLIFNIFKNINYS